MRAVPVDFLKCGTFLGRDLVDDQGQVLLYRGVCLTEAYLRSLRDRGYEYVYVKERVEPDVVVDEDLSPVVRHRATKALKTAMDEIESSLSALKKEAFEDIVKALQSDHVRALMSQKGVLDELSDIVSALLDEVLSRRTLAGLTSMKTKDSRLFQHCLDVAVVAIMIGKAMNLQSLRLRQLATGCLVHDIGMLFLDPTMKEVQRLKQHSTLGYELLRNTSDPDVLSPHVAFEHHERQDGLGQPRGLMGSNKVERVRTGNTPVPTLIGEIAAVANHFDNLLSGVDGREPLTTDAAIGEIMDVAGTQFNREIVSAFVRVVPVFPMGTEVILRGEPYDRFVGVVSEINPNALDRPVVLLYHDSRGDVIVPIEVDTSMMPDLRVKTALRTA